MLLYLHQSIVRKFWRDFLLKQKSHAIFDFCYWIRAWGTEWVFADDYDVFMPRSCRWQSSRWVGYLAGVVRSQICNLLTFATCSSWSIFGPGLITHDSINFLCQKYSPFLLTSTKMTKATTNTVFLNCCDKSAMFKESQNFIYDSIKFICQNMINIPRIYSIQKRINLYRFSSGVAGVAARQICNLLTWDLQWHVFISINLEP